MQQPAESKRGRGRPAGESNSRAQILAAARAQFAAAGFEKTTIRAIAAEAGVDAALVMKFFGSKDRLFAAALDIPDDVPDRMVEALEGPREAVGQRVVEAYLGMWQDKSTAAALRAMYRSALTNDTAAERLREFLRVRMNERARNDEALPATSNIAVAASLLLGVVISRELLALPQLTEFSFDELERKIAPVVQSILDMDRDGYEPR